MRLHIKSYIQIYLNYRDIYLYNILRIFTLRKNGAKRHY